MWGALARITSFIDGLPGRKVYFSEPIFFIFSDRPGVLSCVPSLYAIPKPLKFLLVTSTVSPAFISSEQSMMSVPSMFLPLRCRPPDEIFTSFISMPEPISALAPSIIRSSLKERRDISNLNIPKCSPSTIISSVLSSPGILFRRISFSKREAPGNSFKIMSSMMLFS